MDAAFRRYAEDCPDAVMVTARDAKIEYVNAACERVTGYSRSELLGHTPAMLKSGRHEADFYRTLWSALLAGREFRGVFANRRKTGEIYYEDKIVRPFGEGFASFGRDITERARELEKLAYAATHDSLTGLPNRSLFLDRLEQAVRHAARRDEDLTVGIIDLDRFRDTNNRYGHLAGDEVLKAVAERTRGCLREADTVARIGGDEFALLLAGTGKAGAAAVLSKIVAANGKPVRYDGRELRSSVSVGACSFPLEAASALELQKRADLRMYEAKGAGGNRYVL
jgi:diguanylate cyclase (GGDEF)-like protein/PAS domain S-box-containing protein